MPQVLEHCVTPERARELKRRIKERSAELTMLPAAALQALKIGKDPSVSIDDFAAVIERDFKLSADILGMANSTLYSTGSPVSDLRGAILRLGLRQCQNLILAACTTSMLRRLPIKETILRQKLWSHCFLTGLICRHLNQFLRLGFQGEEFTAGLLHDVGRCLLVAALPEEYGAPDQIRFDEDAETLLREQSKLGTDHCEIGTWFAMRNGLPADLVEVIEFHHTPDWACQHAKLVSLVAVADHMANHFESHSPGAPYDPDANPFVPSLSNHKVSRKDVDAVVEEVTQEEFVRACRLMMPD